MTLRPLVAASLLALLALTAGAAAAEDSHLTFMLQNDVFAGTDGGGYTNGIALSHMRTPSRGETAVRPQWLLAPVAPWLGLGPATLTISSINQVMVTPQDISRKIPDPADAPYLGALWFRAAQVSVRDDIADMLAVNLGMIGPASGARQSQTVIHRITGSTRPQGWDAQVSNRALLGVERYRAIRFASGEGGIDGGVEHKTSADAIVLAGAALGNLQSSVGASLLLRYGSGLQRSYPTALRQVSRTGDPTVLGRGWFVYAGLHADHMFSHVGIGDHTPVEGSTARLREAQVAAVAGIAYGWDDCSLSFSLQSTSSLTTANDKRKGYGSLSYTSRWR